MPPPFFSVFSRFGGLGNFSIPQRHIEGISSAGVQLLDILNICFSPVSLSPGEESTLVCSCMAL